MDVETWKTIWKLVFIASSVAFYAVVIAVGIKGFGDVAYFSPSLNRYRVLVRLVLKNTIEFRK